MCAWCGLCVQGLLQPSTQQPCVVARREAAVEQPMMEWPMMEWLMME